MWGLFQILSLSFCKLRWLLKGTILLALQAALFYFSVKYKQEETMQAYLFADFPDWEALALLCDILREWQCICLIHKGMCTEPRRVKWPLCERDWGMCLYGSPSEPGTANEVFSHRNPSMWWSALRLNKVISQPAESTAHDLPEYLNLSPALKGTKTQTEASWSLWSWNHCKNASNILQLETADLDRDIKRLIAVK